MGCCGGGSNVVRDRVLPSEERPINIPTSVMVLVVNQSDEEIVGFATGFNYGRHNRGDAFQIPIADYDGDKRFVKATAETLRMFT